MIYFDNASTTKVDPFVKKKIMEAYDQVWGNPSSLHSLGFEAEKAINSARDKIARKLKVNSKSIFFVPSGTIANNAVLNAFDKEGANIVMSNCEHSSSYYSSLHKKAQVRYANADSQGFIDIEDLVDKVDENTSLVSIIHVNNELGSINDINEIAKRVKEKNPKTLVHSDGVQALNKIDISLNDIDCYTISSHKVNGPKGIAGLYIKNKDTFTSLYHGGAQESRLFSGTENVQGIIGFGYAVELDNNIDQVKKINTYLREELAKIEDSLITSPTENVSPYIINICFKGIGSEILLHYLEIDSIYISTGSACNKGDKSRVLEAIKINEEFANGCIRISLSKDSTLEEAETFARKVKEKVEIIRGIIK